MAKEAFPKEPKNEGFENAACAGEPTQAQEGGVLAAAHGVTRTVLLSSLRARMTTQIAER